MDSGWHRDPVRRFHERWWDGERWTDRVRTSTGYEQTDPAPSADEIAAAVRRRTSSTAGPAGGFQLPPGASAPPGPLPYLLGAIALLAVIVLVGVILT